MAENDQREKGSDAVRLDYASGDWRKASEDSWRRKGHVLGLREKVLAVVACVGVVAAVAGFGLYASATPPSDAAAKVDDSYIADDDVANWISQYRVSNGLQDDSDFASALLEQNLNVATLRQSAINQLALSLLIDERAEELDVVASDEEVQDQLAAVKDSYAFSDDEIWLQTLSDLGMSEDDMAKQCRNNLNRQAICEADVERRDATDDELLIYMQGYLAGSTQKHAYRIVFTGDNASERAQSCYNELAQLQSDGELDLDAFAAAALEHSDEDGVADSRGSYAWSGSHMADEAKEALEYIEVGGLSDPESVSADDAVEIFFVDTDYTFPSSSDLSEIPADIPDDLMSEVREAAIEYVWSMNCNAYLASLLSKADITYYPIPDDAPYNVSMYATE